MKIDLYTKGILTVIAFALVIIVARDINLVDKASAHDGLNEDEVESLIKDLPHRGHLSLGYIFQEIENRCTVYNEKYLDCN
tara:strand:+ start:590 stop:832 length:243 start_codon:yes stop_codon:yes gene_type:complete